MNLKHFEHQFLCFLMQYCSQRSLQPLWLLTPKLNGFRPLGQRSREKSKEMILPSIVLLSPPSAVSCHSHWGQWVLLLSSAVLYTQLFWATASGQFHLSCWRKSWTVCRFKHFSSSFSNLCFEWLRMLSVCPLDEVGLEDNNIYAYLLYRNICASIMPKQYLLSSWCARFLVEWMCVCMSHKSVHR